MHTLFPSVFLVLCIVPALCNYTCVTRTSTISGTSDNDTATVQCTQSETLVSCGFFTVYPNEKRGGGTTVTNMNGEAYECVATNGHDNRGVYAYARCCTFTPDDISCIGYSPDVWADGDDVTTTIKCNDIGKQYITGCASFSKEGSIDGAYPGSISPVYADKNINYPLTDQSCTHQDGGSSGASKASLVCCDSPTYALECVTRYGPKGNASIVKCDDTYTLIGCSAYGRTDNVNGWGIISDVCAARSGCRYMVWAIAICCKLQVPTLKPTSITTSNATSIAISDMNVTDIISITSKINHTHNYKDESVKTLNLGIIFVYCVLAIVCVMICCVFSAIIFVIHKILGSKRIYREKVNSNETVEIVNDADDTEVLLWLKQMSLEEYYPLFIKNGLRTMEDIITIDNEELLSEIGIKSVGHRIWIWRKIKQLRKPNFNRYKRPSSVGTLGGSLPPSYDYEENKEDKAFNAENNHGWMPPIFEYNDCSNK